MRATSTAGEPSKNKLVNAPRNPYRISAVTGILSVMAPSRLVVFAESCPAPVVGILSIIACSAPSRLVVFVDACSTPDELEEESSSVEEEAAGLQCCGASKKLRLGMGGVMNRALGWLLNVGRCGDLKAGCSDDALGQQL